MKVYPVQYDETFHDLHEGEQILTWHLPTGRIPTSPPRALLVGLALTTAGALACSKDASSYDVIEHENGLLVTAIWRHGISVPGTFRAVLMTTDR